jgi:hypothetical protein
MASAGSAPGASLDQAVRSAFDSFVNSMPSLIAALLLVAAGWLLARLARRGARELASLANRFLSHSLHRRAAADARLSLAFISVIGELAFWLVLIVALVLAAGVVGVGSVGQWLNQIVTHLPSLIVGLAIVITGYFLSIYLRELVISSARDRGAGPASALGHTVQAIVITIALIIGLDQAGIDVMVLVIVFAIGAAGLVAGVVLTFVAGSRNFASNIIGARNARGLLQPGLRVRIDDLEGEVLEISLTHIALDTTEGKALIPASELDTRRLVIITSTAEPSTADD